MSTRKSTRYTGTSLLTKTTVPRPTISLANKSKLVASTSDDEGIVSTTSKARGKTTGKTKIQATTAPAVPDASAMRRTKSISKSISDDPMTVVVDNLREHTKKAFVDNKRYKEIFANEDIDDNNALVLRDYLPFLRVITNARRKCQKICFCWLEEGLYIIFFDIIEYEKNMFFFPKDRVPQYRFNGTPRYYYVAPRDMSTSTNQASSDSIVIFNERLIEEASNAYPSYKGSGKEVLEIVTVSQSGTETSHIFDIMFDRTTSGLLPADFLDKDIFCESKYVKLAQAKTKWDLVASTMSSSDNTAKKILKPEQHDCTVVYNNEENKFRFEIDNGSSKISFLFTNETPALTLNDPFGFKLGYPANNILKGIKGNYSQKMHLMLNTPGFLKMEIVCVEYNVCVILDTKELGSGDADDASTMIEEKKIKEKIPRAKKSVAATTIATTGGVTGGVTGVATGVPGTTTTGVVDTGETAVTAAMTVGEPETSPGDVESVTITRQRPVRTGTTKRSTKPQGESLY